MILKYYAPLIFRPSHSCILRVLPVFYACIKQLNVWYFRMLPLLNMQHFLAQLQQQAQQQQQQQPGSGSQSPRGTSPDAGAANSDTASPPASNASGDASPNTSANAGVAAATPQSVEAALQQQQMMLMQFFAKGLAAGGPAAGVFPFMAPQAAFGMSGGPFGMSADQVSLCAVKI